MTHYKVDYSTMTPQQAHLQSIHDIKEFLGKQRYIDITREFRLEPPMALEQFRMYVSICGVQGFPVRAWHDECWPYG